jgi:hypothetical protein
MLKLSRTKENVSFVEWHNELKIHFTIWEWEKLPSETDPFFFLFMDGKTVAQALTEGKLLLSNLSIKPSQLTPMSSKDFTNENSSFVDWMSTVKSYFYFDEWNKIFDPFETFYALFTEGKSVIQAVKKFKLVDELECFAMYNHPELGETEIALTEVFRVRMQWRARIKATGEEILLYDDEFTV